MMSIEDDIKQIKKDIKEIKQRLLMEGNVPDTKNVFLNNEELAKRWGIRASSLYQTRRKGFTDSKYKDLKYIKLGNKVAYRLSDVIAFEDTREFKLGVSTFENEEKDINEIEQRPLMDGNVQDISLTTEELAKRWNLSARTLENSRQKNYTDSPYKDLRYYKFGRKITYKLSDVIAFEDTREFKLGVSTFENEEKDINEIVQRTHMEDNITDTENTLLTTQELAKRWNMSARTLENSRHKGSASSKYKNLKYIKFGNKVSYKLSDVIAFENSTISVLVNPREFKLGSVSVGNEEDDS
jgi:hypothetical protein